MNLAGRTILAAALAAAVVGTGSRAMAECGGEPPPPPAATTETTADPKAWILDAKMRVLEIKADAAALLDKAQTQEAKDALKQVISDCDRVYSILEDKLVND